MKDDGLQQERKNESIEMKMIWERVVGMNGLALIKQTIFPDTRIYETTWGKEMLSYLTVPILPF